MKVEKILESYSILPEPYRSQAIKNYDHNFRIRYTDCLRVSDYNNELSYYITVGFKWDETPEGHEYWFKFRDFIDDDGVYEKLRREYILKLL